MLLSKEVYAAIKFQNNLFLAFLCLRSFELFLVSSGSPGGTSYNGLYGDARRGGTPIYMLYRYVPL